MATFRDQMFPVQLAWKQRTLPHAVGAILLVTWGCTDDKAGAKVATTDTTLAFDVTIDPGDATPADIKLPGLDVVPNKDIVANCPGGAGCACKDNTDCQSGLCIDDASVPDGKACAQKCDSTCASGYACANIPAAGGDIISVCVPKFLHLCEPCSVSKDCESLGLKDTACIDQGVLGRFCGVSCAANSDCPANYDCTDVTTAEGGKLKQCVRKPDDKQSPFGLCTCTTAAVQKKSTTACWTEVKDGDGKVVGKCAGVRSCTAAGLGACTAGTAKAEVCNGADDDCDGLTDESSCDDTNACTKDTCDPAKGCEHASLQGDPCDADGSACTAGDACKDGVCVAGPAKNCDDKNPCTADSCDLAKGCTQVADDGKPCDADGTACTPGDVCLGGTCQKAALTMCDDGNPCTVDKCDPTSGQCVTSAEDDGIPCNDGTKCTSKDACLGGVCKGKAVDCDDSNPCTDDTCDKEKGCSPQALTGAPCSDDNPCTVGDSCDGGSCKAGGPKACAAPGSCYVASCEPIAGKCVFDLASAGLPCDDANACTAKDACDQGKCKGTVKDCDDANACTDDGCDAKTGCTSAANTSPCSDGNPCTVLDKCSGGLCAGKPIDAKLDCDDGNPCTTDSCEPKAGCSHTNNLGACDDGNPCTKGDQCGDGKCQGGSSSCGCQSDADCAAQDDADLCNGVLYCDKGVVGQFACKTKPGSVVQCDEGLNTACMQQVCEVATGKCGAKPGADGKGCDADSSVCTSNDSCASGVCKPGAAVACDDKNPCTTDLCDAKLGCTYVANTASCDADSSACTVGDTCQGKVCLGGAKKPCDDAEPCTADGCNPATGLCTTDGAPLAGKPCDDGSLCTEGDVCAAGTCASGKSKVCNDGNPCTDDSCDAKNGCVYPANTSPCDDGNACTQADVCAGSVCAGKSLNPQVDCNDGQVCTADGCDPKLGCIHGPNQVGCDDGNPCTQGDLCANKACAAGSNVCGCQKDADCAAQEDGDLCNGTLYCDTTKVPYGCKVKAATVVSCDGSKDTACSTTICDGKTGKCGPVAAPDGKGCDADGSVCSSGDACLAGVCKPGAWINCEDNQVCTDDSCDPKLGCLHVANAGPCDADGSVCTVGDGCKDKVCLAGVKKVCDDGNVCTDDGCDKAAGCKSVVNTLGCDDGNACTVGDVCAAKACKAGGLLDVDGDGFPGVSCGGTDCNDGKKAVNPGVKEDCLTVGVDENCNGVTDEGCVVLNANGCPPTGSGTSCGSGKGTCGGGLCQYADVNGYKWTLVPAGKFWMGCNQAVDSVCSSRPNENPQHEVNLSAYWIGVHEVTATQYKACVSAGASGCTVPSMTTGTYATYATDGKDQHPINYVNWSQARAVCKWLGGDLPTEAQWEKAARGGCEVYEGKECKTSERLFPWGSAAPVCGQNAVMGGGGSCAATMAVGAGSASGQSPYGAYDVAGNIVEWVMDWVDDGSFYAAPATQDPVNASGTWSSRGVRGGSFDGVATNLRAGVRGGLSPNQAYSTLGVRCAKPMLEALCDDKDDNGNGQTDEGCDDDNDDYCDSAMTAVGIPTVCPKTNGGMSPGMVGNDCNDALASVNPGLTEACGNGVDDNCNGVTDEGCVVLNANGCPPTGSGTICGSGKGTCSSGLCQYADVNGYKWTLVPAGKFWMGCNSAVDSECAGNAAENPQHEVDLSAYWVGVYEVTAEIYKKCVTTGGSGCTQPSTTGGGNHSTYGTSGKEQHAVNYINWAQSRAVCKWLGGDLPTEAQWEKAARGGCEVYEGKGKDCKASESLYPWGSAAPVCGVNAVTGGGGQCAATMAVGAGSASGQSPCGAYDMAGNVWEWTMDWYDGSFYAKAGAVAKDAVNGTGASYRVIRGGGFDDAASYLRAGFRSDVVPGGSGHNVGVRCSKSFP